MNTKTTQTTPGKTGSGQTTAGKVKDDEAANIPGLVTSLAETEKKTKKPKTKKRRPDLKAFAPQTPDASVHQWFFTLMCMNIPIIGWFYLEFCESLYVLQASVPSAGSSNPWRPGLYRNGDRGPVAGLYGDAVRAENKSPQYIMRIL